MEAHNCIAHERVSTYGDHTRDYQSMTEWERDTQGMGGGVLEVYADEWTFRTWLSRIKTKIKFFFLRMGGKSTRRVGTNIPITLEGGYFRTIRSNAPDIKCLKKIKEELEVQSGECTVHVKVTGCNCPNCQGEK